MPTIEPRYDLVSEHRQAADRLATQVLLRAEAAGFAIGAEIRYAALHLFRHLANSGPTTTRQFLASFLRDFRTILNRYEDVLARTISDSQMAAWLQGGVSVLRVLPEEITTTKTSPLRLWDPPTTDDEAEPIVRFDGIDEAVADLQERRLLNPDELDLYQQAARETGTTAAQGMSRDAIEKVRDALVEAVLDGDTLDTFKLKIVDAIDGSKMNERAQEKLFRSTVQFAYARGQRAIVQNPSVRSVAPFCWRSEIDDSRLTDLCRALSHSGIQGTSIYCVDDPVWARIVAPPSHHNCRCGVIYLTIERAAQKGLRVAQQWLETGARPSDEELFVTLPPEVEAEIVPGWITPWAA